MAYGNEGSKPISQASAKGKVKWFNATKSYGFITLDNGGDAFCHASALQTTVSFRLEYSMALSA